jgi:hypothetical protein
LISQSRGLGDVYKRQEKPPELYSYGGFLFPSTPQRRV